MNSRVRPALCDIIKSASDPIMKGRKILEEEYRKGGGVGETCVSISANFEIVRSLIVQAAYEAVGDSGRTGWLEAGQIDLEMEDARETRWYRLMDGIGYALKEVPDSVFSPAAKLSLCSLESEAIGEERFLGAVRRYVPGVGYAISVRKRTSENQDSFIVAGTPERKRLALADGCGSERFSALASHICMGLDPFDGKAGIISVNDFIAARMNTWEYMMHSRGDGERMHGLGTSTLLAASVLGNSKKVYRVGDSIGFATFEGVVQELADEAEFKYAVGYPGLEEGHIEEHDAANSQLVLTSDGATNYVNEASFLLAKITAITTDAVITAERLLRAVLSSQVRCEHADDVTIIVEDIGEISR